MCCCATPNVNGQLGYRWQPKDVPSVRRPDPPTVDTNVLYDLPGRCGGQDSHCHHYQLLGSATGLCWPELAYKHGGGEGRIRLSNAGAVLAALNMLDDHGRYWLCNAIYHATADAGRTARDAESARWRVAAAERRIKVRKVRGSATVRVTIAA